MTTINKYKEMKTRLFIMIMAILGMVAIQACSDDDDKKSSDVPASFTEAFSQLYPNVKNVKWELKKNYRVAEFSENNGQVETEVWFDSDAKVAMTANDYGKNLFYIPAVVNSAFEATEYAKAPWTVDDIDYYQRKADAFYVIEVEAANKQDVSLFFDKEGKLIKTVEGQVADITPDSVL